MQRFFKPEKTLSWMQVRGSKRGTQKLCELREETMLLCVWASFLF